MKPARKRTKKAAEPIRSCPRSRGTLVLGRVNPDFTAFPWGVTDYELKMAAEAISKHIEAQYQLALFRSSGFGSDES